MTEGRVAGALARIRTLCLQDYLLILWLLFVLLINLLWLSIDHRPPRWDESTNLWFSERAYQLIQSGNIIEALRTHGATRPNFVPFVSALSYFVVGDNTKTAIFLLNSVSLSLIFLSIYGLGRIFYGRNAGLLACVLFSCYPGVSLWNRYYNLDLPLTAAVSLTVFLSMLLMRSDYKSRVYSTALAVVVAAGICSKHLYVLFVLFPLAYLVVMSWRHSLKETILSRSWFLGVLLLGILMGGVYHFVLNYETFHELLIRAVVTEKSVLLQPGSGYSMPTRSETIRSFFAFEFGDKIVFVLLFLAGLPFVCLRRDRFLPFLFFWLGGILFILLFVIKVTMPYYFHPALPVFSLISAGWLIELRREKSL